MADVRPVDPTPEDIGGPISKQEANYRDGNLTYHCGLCKNYEGAGNKTCTKVLGKISPYGLSDEYDGAKIPRRLRRQTPAHARPRPGGFRPAGRPVMESAADEPDQPMPPITRIGRKVY